MEVFPLADVETGFLSRQEKGSTGSNNGEETGAYMMPAFSNASVRRKGANL